MSNIKRFFKMMMKYRKEHLIAIVLLTINGITYSMEPFFTKSIIDVVIPQKNVVELLKLTGMFLTVIIIEKVSKLFSDFVYSEMGKSFTFQLKRDLISHLQKQSGDYYCKMKAGEINNIINNDVDTLEDIATKMLFTTIKDIITSVPIIVYLFILKKDLFLVLLLIYPITYFVQKKFSKKIEYYSIQARIVLEDYVTIINEFLKSPINYVKLGNNTYFKNKFKESEEKYKKYGIKSDKVYSEYITLSTMTNYIVLLAILLIGGYGIIENNMTIGIMVVFIQYSSKMVIPILAISQANVRIKQSKESVDRIFQILDSRSSISEELAASQCGINNGEILIQGVSFSYDTREILHNLTMLAKAGEKVAIVGESGSGKSTIINLLYRLWDFKEGNIYIDGVEIHRFNINYLREKIGIVSQDIFLFHDTILNNLTLGNADISMEQVIEVAKKVNIYNDIVNLDLGFNTVIGDNGVKLSGGQKQRLSIARTILKNNPIIVFDEATSALDNHTEMEIEFHLLDYFKNKTLIIISHRLKSIVNANRIYVLENGMIKESGTYDELIQSKSLFCSIFNLQF
ncbi:putative multidrug export ATP-binding/permease protein [Lachnospiraceae bacterium]|nr:putative multidrug export ATP-binding/permease protein [Lachnospiraceae bacterium]